MLEKIANKVSHNASDHTDVYFILEDDVAFVHDQRAKEEWQNEDIDGELQQYDEYFVAESDEF